MNENPTESVSPAARSRRLRAWPHGAQMLAVVLLAYGAFAYVLMPQLWRHYTHRHPAIDDTPGVTTTGDGHPGDPINVALAGAEADLQSIMQQAGWFAATRLGLRSDVRIAADTVLDRPDDEAPVSKLFLWGRMEDLAFEQPVGDNPKQRHHVRFWKSAKTDAEGRPLWVGSATYDERVGLSHTTGQITHHIAADVDAERDHLFHDLQQTGRLTDVQFVDDFHKVREGRNGGGDRWFTDGRLETGVIKPAG